MVFVIELERSRTVMLYIISWSINGSRKERGIQMLYLGSFVQDGKAVACYEDDATSVPSLPVSGRIFDLRSNIFWQADKFV